MNKIYDAKLFREEQLGLSLTFVSGVAHLARAIT